MENILTLDRALDVRSDEHSSGVSWGAVIGGAFVAASISLIMLALGAGFGLAAVSPWSTTGASSSTLSSAAICWLIAIQMVSCALGGYLAGRLRTKWKAVHTDEVFFRDTANGFLVWAVGLVITVTFLVSAASNMAGGSRNESRSETAAGKGAAAADAYFVDVLFRSDGHAQVGESVQGEAGRILALTLLQKDTRPGDLTYLANLVAAKTGLSLTDAEARVSQVVSDARLAEDAVRQTTSRLLLWIFLALMIGAFSASYAATIGGRQRDHVKVV